MIIFVQNLQHSIVEPLSNGVNTLEAAVIRVHSVGEQHCDNPIGRICTHQGPSVATVDTNKKTTINKPTRVAIAAEVDSQ